MRFYHGRLADLQAARRLLIYVLVALACMLLVACAGGLDWRGTPQAEAAARVAQKMVGKPYRYGGYTPHEGFDCSGLVYYSYNKVGVSVPRTTKDQRRESKSVSVSNRKKGDLLFFNEKGWHASHVGLYIGNDEFVHAPSRGKPVRIDSLSDPYWQKHLVEVRRFEAAVVALEDDPRPPQRRKGLGSGFGSAR